MPWDRLKRGFSPRRSGVSFGPTPPSPTEAVFVKKILSREWGGLKVAALKLEIK